MVYFCVGHAPYGVANYVPQVDDNIDELLASWPLVLDGLLAAKDEELRDEKLS